MSDAEVQQQPQEGAAAEEQQVCAACIARVTARNAEVFTVADALQRHTAAHPPVAQAVGEQQGAAAGPADGQANDELASMSKTQRKKLMKRQL